jgi:light-regulated signal transduction histidine kinase (bacteriophytochrome)
MEKYPGIETTPMFASMRDCMEKRSLQLAEFEFVYPDGEHAWFQFSIQPVPEGISVLSLDITERKQAVEALLNMNEELERRVQERTTQLEATNSELEAFTYSVSHDLRAPLRAMSGFARQLQDRFADDMPERAQHYLNRIDYNASRMGNLIDDLLTLSRVGRKSLDTRQVKLRHLVQDILRELDTDSLYPQVKIQIDDLPDCRVDPALMKQAYQNLITNALKFSQKKEAPHIHIGFEQTNGDRVFFVKDNGVGFDMEFAHKLFGVFERLHSAQEYEGTGIGLATVQRVIQRHGGRVWANAELGEGAEFYFTLGGEDTNGH